MNLKRLLCRHTPLFALASLGILSNLSAEEAKSVVRPWPHEGSDLKPEAAIKWGKLDNGLRYAIMPNAEPPGRVSMRLYVDAGSLMEDDDQQGLAHFLEHMAFNGTENFPAGEMIEYFQRRGLGFGSHTNAHTSFKETVYKLDLPKVDEDMIRKSLQLFADYAGKMQLAEEEIEKERGVILSEKLSRDSVGYRMLKEGFKFSLPDSKVSRRMPIGTKEVIESAPRKRFVDFYNKWYTTDRMVVVIVGDIEPAKIESLIVEYFEDVSGPTEIVPDPDLGKVTNGRGTAAKYHYEAEMHNTSISIECAKPSKARPDNTELRKLNLRIGLANNMMDRRFEILAKAEGAPFTDADTRHGDYFDFVEFASVEIECKAEDWEGAIGVAEKELRRALLYGFTQDEFDEAKANLLNAYRQHASRAGTRQSASLANSIVDTLGDGMVFTDPADDLARVEQSLGEVTPEECLEEFRNLWEDQDRLIFVGGNAKIEGGNPEEKILAVFKKSSAEQVEPPKEREAVPFAYTDFGDTGKVASKKLIEDLDITQVVFENNVRLNIKPTDFEENSVRVSIRFGGGKLEIPKDKPGIDSFASSTYDAAGLEAHSADELGRIFAGKTVGASFSVGDDAFVLAGRTNMEDLKIQMQLLAAYMTAPGYRKEAERQFLKQVDAVYTQLAHTMEGAMQDKVVRFLRGGDNRFGFPEKDEFASRNLDEVKEWLADALTKSYVEITVVGDVDVEAAIDSVASTFGALPKRAESKPSFEEERKIEFPDEPKESTFTYTSEIPRAVVSVYWHTDDMSDIRRTRRLGLLGSVFKDRLRLKVREEMGSSYSPSSYHVASDTFTGYGYVVAQAICTPDQAEAIGKIAREISEDLRTGEISDDEFERAIKPQITSVEQLRRDNRYWMGSVMGDSQERPERLDWARNFEEDFKAITKEELEALAKKYLGAEKAIQVVVKPEEG